ncbi:hypothetical protein ACFYZ8_41295 [Streptomyces sp. NPDC001668]|uniref:hypothetical protein n=1 Tax=unclassified Streptomyces TaxID=2593676 RepID=UPI0036B7AA6F
MYEPEQYPPRARQQNIALLDAMFQAHDQVSFDAASGQVVEWFHRSVLSEFDWITQRTPVNQRDTILALGDHLDALVAERHCATPRTADRLVAIVEALTQTVRSACDAAALLRFVGMHLTNALLVLLDDPATRRAARRFAQRWRGLGGEAYLLEIRRPPAEESPPGNDWASGLAQIRNLALNEELEPLARLTDHALALLAARDRSLDKYEGDWLTGVGPCARCAMSFASRVVTCIDESCDFVGSFGSKMVLVRAGLNTESCLFCGYRAILNSPALFYSPSRSQVVYFVPRWGGMTEDDALATFGSFVTASQESYLARLPTEDAKRFEEASELIAWSWSEFLYAIHFGETIGEDHVFNLVRFNTTGGGLLIDFTKGFMRELAPEEVIAYQALPHVETGPLLAENLRQSMEQGNGSDAVSTDIIDDDVYRAVARTLLEYGEALGGENEIGQRMIVRG